MLERRQERLETGTIQPADQIRDIRRIGQGRQSSGQSRLRECHGWHWGNAERRIRYERRRRNTSLHRLSLVEHDFRGDVGVNLRVVCVQITVSTARFNGKGVAEKRTTEANIIGPRASIKHLKGNFAGKLVRSRQSNDGEDAFNVLAMNCCTQWDARPKYQHIYTQTPVAKGIFDMKNEVPRASMS